MKKILSTAAAVVLAASLISCGDSGDSYTNTATGAVDTVLTIQAPVITKAVAYAGVNYITWNPVAQAERYDIYRTADGEPSGKYLTSVNAAKGTAYADVATSTNILADGFTYNYTIVANAANGTQNAGSIIPSRSIYVQPNSATTSVKAYVPAAGTKLTDFTDLYTKNFLSLNYKDADTIKSKAKLTFANDEIGGGKINASFPATAGYQFGVKFINNTQVSYIKKENTNTSVSQYLENYVANTSAETLEAGKYTAYLTMKSVCPYYPTPIVYEIGEIEVKALDVSSKTTGVKAKFIDKENVVVSWTPAILKSTNAAAPIANYKVYRLAGNTLGNGDELVPVTATITEATEYTAGLDSDSYINITNGTNYDGVDGTVSSNGTKSGKNELSKIYTLTDKVPANVIYTYYVVNTDGTEFENTAATGTTPTAYVSGSTPNEYAQETTDPAYFVSTGVAHQDASNLNTIKVKVQKANVKQSLALSYVQLDKTVTAGNGYQTVLPADFTACAALANNDETDETFISYDVKAAYGTYLFKLTATEAGKAAQNTYKIVQVDYVGANINTKNVSMRWYNPNTKGENQSAVYWYTGSAEDQALYNYEIVTVTETKSKNSFYADYVTVGTAKAELKFDAAASVKAEDWNDADKSWTKTGLKSIIANGTTGTVGNDNFRYVTYPYAVKDLAKGDSKDGVSVTKTVSVKVTLKQNSNIYKFTDNDERTSDNKITVQY